MCCRCVDYLLTSLTITTSTHTNYFDRLVKERRAFRPVESDYYTDTSCLVNTLSLISSPTPSELIHSSKQALHSNLYQAFVNVEVNKVYLFPKMIDYFQKSLITPESSMLLIIFN